jgi:pSer/pThr/pTyr-binding forkhead associated (FHA) protein
MTILKKKITIGRKSSNIVVLNTNDVSGEHAILILLNEKDNLWEIQDIGSANGTFVDGLRIVRKEVTPNNQIILGKTLLPWDKILGNAELEKPSTVAPPVVDSASILPENEEDNSLSLKEIYDEYKSKKSRFQEIQIQEALNARVQTLGIPLSGLIAASTALLDSKYRIIPIVGAMVSVGFTVAAYLKSRTFTQEKKLMNMTELEEWYKINYRCPNPQCGAFITEPYPVLKKQKMCRVCKKPLIP